MSRAYVLAHYIPHKEDMSVVSSQGDQQRAKNASADSKAADSFEIEVFKSQIVTVASCVFSEDPRIGNVGSIRFKSCGDQLTTESGQNVFLANDIEHKKGGCATERVAEHKARRFKRISLQWLLKPSRRASHSSSRIRTVNGRAKQRVTRINSAPKSFGHSGKTETQVTDSKENKVHSFDGRFNEDIVQHDRGQISKNDSRKMRRISLPAPVLDGSGSAVDKRQAPDIFHSRTPEERRKHVVEFDEKFIQSLKINEPDVMSERRRKLRTTSEESHAENVGQDPVEKSTSTRDPRDTFSHVQNVKKETGSSSNSNVNSKLASRPALKLHKFHNPDIFYMPLPDDDSQTAETNLSHKLCRARLIEPRTKNSVLQDCIKEELQSYLHDKQFCSRSCQRWCLELSQNIKAAVHRLKQCEIKIACVVYIAALRGHGVHAAAQCILTPNEDNFITVNFKNRSMIALASVLAIKYV
ncbi:uncharacterized protein [Montipora capricornis]|uniref:uncharacterized protein n=1 Tax=Montipora foliosa TaxID=591990 RepID=UPI0035F18383